MAARHRKSRLAKNCNRKQSYDTYQQAASAAYRPKHMLAVIGYMSAYRCKICRKYHYGHPEGF